MTIQEALQRFAAAVSAEMSTVTRGEPEDQLRAPFESFIADVAYALGWDIICASETRLPDRLGKPDYAVHLHGLLAGYVELKSPGSGVNPSRYGGYDRDQWRRFRSITNLIYCDGNEWGLYRGGQLVDNLVRLSGDIVAEGKGAIGPRDAHELERLLRDFLAWQPVIPTDRRGKVDLKKFAEMLAPLCRMLREDVTEALRNPNSPLVQLAKDWRQLLFPDASDRQFADAYAQTVTFALLLSRSEGADPLTLDTAEKALAAQHSLLSRALQVLTDRETWSKMSASLDLILRVIGAAPASTLAGVEDPWLCFYEDFLAVYDSKLRKDVGAYYTPPEVVHAQVRLIDRLLETRLGKPLGFTDPAVITLDPAVGTGTYLLGVIEHALRRVEAEQGSGAVPGQASILAANLYGFELLVGPLAVAELCVSRSLRDRGANLPPGGSQIYLTHTLESPRAELPQLPLFLRPIAEQHAKALKVKSNAHVIVCLGNPPYERHEAANKYNRARTGGWVRWGDDEKGSDAILRDFLDPAIAAGHGVRVHNLYNLYVYFWRWALWKVFEHETSRGPGIVSFISAASYLDGEAFCGMREHMRRVCDEIWILDVGGEGRGTKRSDNVFAIQTPVAIAVAVRSGKARLKKPAKVRYARIEGNRQVKLAALNDINDFAAVQWHECPNDWQASFRPAGKGDYFNWPLLTDLMPWRQSGVKAGRTWVIAPEEEALKERWRFLVNADRDDRKELFKDSPTGRKAHQAAKQLPPSGTKLKPINDLAKESRPPDVIRFAYRSFDRQFIFADTRVLDRPSPELWRARGQRQIYLTSIFSQPLEIGPALTCSSSIPDLHHFSGRGAKDCIPLYRNAEATEANILPDLLELLGKTYKRKVSPEDFAAYAYGMLAQPAFSERYAKELETRQLRAPITKDSALFFKVRDIGARLLWLHTYGERFVPRGKQRGHVPRGATKCIKTVPGDPGGYPDSFDYSDATRTLRVGDGEFQPVAQEIFEFEVSRLKVVQSWLKYRMKRGAGKKSSPLDEIRPERWTGQFTTELLELLWVLEATVEGYPEQARLLHVIIASPSFRADELPSVSDEAGKHWWLVR